MPFVKGQSGNPGGRPKENDEVKRLAREHGPEAIERLVYWMRQDDAKASVPASNALLDRGYGKPTQAVEATGKDGEPLQLHDPRQIARAVVSLLSTAADEPNEDDS